uniref:Reverse transcriptase domain-containing protein n=1 Tax=Cyprinus carpio TaxID=7962 RepID=A0A8C2B6N7_CYPCA
MTSISHCKTISPEDRDYCDDSIAQEKVLKAIKNLKNNKSPGCDGITAELYKMFDELLTPFLVKVFSESLEKEALPTTMTQGVITLIPKPEKDRNCLENWRPITLLNNDYKIFALVFANRLKEVLDTIIDESQSGFMRKRHNANNIRLVLDLLDYNELITDNSFILFLDFYKSFDSLEHGFILQALKKFGFGDGFCRTVRTLYTNGSSAIKLKSGTSPRFKVSRGIKQGCPISPYLFLIASQLLALHVSNSALEGITLAERSIILSQLADDTTIFLRNASQIPLAIELIRGFSQASGLKLNLKKCELLAVKDCDVSNIYDIPVKDQVTHLGIIITKDQNTRSPLNFSKH